MIGDVTTQSYDIAILQPQHDVGLSSQFQALSILTYRHLAIAMSRQNLAYGEFKRDYGVDKNLADAPVAHGTWIAGTIYGPRCIEYQAASRE